MIFDEQENKIWTIIITVYFFTGEVSRPRNRFLRVWRKQVIRCSGLPPGCPEAPEEPVYLWLQAGSAAMLLLCEFVGHSHSASTGKEHSAKGTRCGGVRFWRSVHKLHLRKGRS